MVGPVRVMEERPAAVEGDGLAPCPLPGPEIRQTAELRSSFVRFQLIGIISREKG